MFVVRESLLLPIWFAFSVHLIVVWIVFNFSTLIELRARMAYEMVALRKRSDSSYTDETLWADRLVEIRQSIVEPMVWILFAAMVYCLAHFF